MQHKLIKDKVRYLPKINQHFQQNFSGLLNTMPDSSMKGVTIPTDCSSILNVTGDDASFLTHRR